MELKTGLTYLLLLTGLLAGPASGQTLASELAVYTIEAETSIIRVYVGRSGPLARLGHNHVIHSRELSGQINLAQDRLNSTGSFSFPVNSFVVDDASERERAGDAFESEPGESAIEGTRENMLGVTVLNADAYSEISVTATPESISDDQWLLSLELAFQGNTISLEIPAQIELTGSRFSVDASFTLAHDDIGLSPFSALGGSLRVAEEIDFEMHIEASAQ
jgi:hypothetical protein